MRRIYFGAALIAVAMVFGSSHLEAQTQKQAETLNSFTHNINPTPISPFFSQTTGDDTTVYNFAAAGALSGDLVAGAAATTNVSGTMTIVGNSSVGTNFNDGNRLPRGITLTYDVSFSVSTTDGELVSAAGNTGNGLGPGALPYGAFDPGESVQFSSATISNVAFTGASIDPRVTFTGGTVSGVGLSQFRSNNFVEASGGATLSNGTETIGFGLSSGTLASSVAMNNGFGTAARFPAMMMDVPITLTMDPATTGTFNLKGFELTTFFDYEFTSPLDDANLALKNFSHNIGGGPDSPFFTQGIGDDGTVYDYAAAIGLSGSIVAGAANSTNVSGTVEIVGNATAANDFLDGNQIPLGVTLSYEISFNISSPDGALTVAFTNTGDGIGIGPSQNETINDGEQLVFSPATISNVAFTGLPTDGSNFTPGTVTDVAFDAFRTNNFLEASSGAVLSNGTDSVGFGLASGSLASNANINNGFASADRFPPMSLLNQLTLTADAGASSFNLKGFELVTSFTYDTGSVLLGDINLDGAVDFLDISPFISVLSGGQFQAEADCNESGTVDFLDISPFIAILSGQ